MLSCLWGIFVEDSSRTFAGDQCELGYFMLGWCNVFLKGLLKNWSVELAVLVHFQFLLVELSMSFREIQSG